MSISYLLLFFLCISLHACNARHLSSLDKKQLEKKSHLFVKNEEENNGFDSLKKHNEGQNKMELLVTDSEKPKNRRMLEAIGKATSALKTESVVSVSWRVPHNKKRSQNKHPGFDLDYSPPKTHPPSHN